MKVLKVFKIPSFSDNRGNLFNTLEVNGNEIVPYNFHIYTINPSFFRGGHYHINRDEFIFTIKGSSIFIVLDNNLKIVEFYNLTRPDEVIFVPAGYVHLLYNNSNEVFYGGSFSPVKGYKGDTVKLNISKEDIVRILKQCLQ